ncbi:RHS repeat domain-containing protein [Streptomyces melanogenes]|uniref:RHS repeat domain-containing protein n=1 Tax=Streptomyces melanogenes TaxID=67326 RepID=UPI0037A1EC80
MRLLAGVLLTALLAPLLGSWPALAAERALVDFHLRKTQQEKSVSGTAVPVKSVGGDPVKGRDYRPGKASWPAAGTAEVDLSDAPAAPALRSLGAGAPAAGRIGTQGLKQAGALPVKVGRTAAPGPLKAAARSAAAAPALDPAPGKVGVSLLDRKAAQQAGVDGLLVRLERKDGKATDGSIRVEMDYSAFAQAYGGDWASRLTLFRMGDGRSGGQALPLTAVKNNPKLRTLSADVPLAAFGAAPATYAVAAQAAGDGGSFAASSLSASQAWAEGGSSGAFTYAYPIETPESPAGEGPTVALSYNSQALDGRTSATNNQSSWIGDGWDYSTGFVERSYKSCSQDMGGGANNTAKTGDLCWGPDILTLSLGGSSSQLVRDEKTGVYRPTKDAGEKVERLTGAANGTDGGEHWKVTATDGTQYFFGLGRLPGWSTGKEETNSAWTVPVAGNNKGEPGYASSFANSFKTQGWRWNLDYVVDPQGNTSTYWYTAERNNYGKNNSDTATPYVRGGHLSAIRYGQKSDELFTAKAPAEVAFTTAERCVPGTGVDCAPDKLTKTTAKNWPDTPFDQICADGAKCTTQKSPTFFSRKRLTDITTRVLVGDALKDVDSYKLEQSFPETGDGMPPPLWLKSVTRTGKDGTPVTLPPVTFTGEQLANRVDGLEGLAPMVRWRVASIKTEAGGVIGATYSAPECTPASLPDPATNAKRCYPVFWAKDGDEKPTIDWFHKYVVTRVVESDTTGGAAAKESSYEYLGAPAWHFDDSEMAKPEHRTWSQWRGYGKVRTLLGTKGQAGRTQTEAVFFRGMDGDKAASGTRSVKVADSEGREITDADPLAGTVRESLTYDGEGGKLLGAEASDPWLRGATASRPRAGLTPLTSWMTATAETRTRSLGEGDQWIRTRKTTTYNDHGEAVEVDDAGDLSTDSDNLCTRTTYAQNPDKWMFEDPERVETVSVSCSATVQRPKDVVTDTVTSYDDKGNVTEVKGLKDYADGTPQYKTAARTTYDTYGRPLTEVDASGKTSRTEYVPATGANPVETTETDVLGNVTTLEINPTRDLPLAQTDPNGRRTDAEYDALGRTLAVWAPGRTKDTQSASVRYRYEMSQTKPSVVTTETLKDDGNYAASNVIYDALLRERQTQVPAVGGGRVNEDSVFDSRGLEIAHNGPYYNDQAVSGDLLKPNDNELQRATGYVYDGAGRPTASVFYSLGDEKWRTTTAYAGNVTTTVPPKGGTPVTTVVDVRGNVVEQRQHRATTGPATFDTTKYTYTPEGDLATITDAAGNTWTNTYDVAGNRTKVTDPDSGTQAMAYDDQGRLTSTTDARGKKTSYEYDIAGRKTAEYEGGTDGTKLASWTYDSLAKGYLSSSTRYQDGRAYTEAIDGYTDDYQPTGMTVTVPAEETGLAGTYNVKFGYTTTGQIAWEQYEAKGGLKAERVTHTYTADGVPAATTGGGVRYVQESSYSPFGEATQLVHGTAGARVGVTSTYDEATRRLERSVVDREVTGGTNTDDRSYVYDPMGNVLGINSKQDNNPLGTDNQCFRYDYLGRTTESWTPKSGCAATSTPKAEDLAGLAPYWHSYTYDVMGNRTSRTTHDTTGDNAKDIKDTYTYNAPGSAQPHAVRKVTTTGGMTGESTFDYDESGNTVKRTLPELPKGQSLQWDASGDLVAADTEGNTSSYLYDAEGKQLITRGPQGVTLNLGDEQFTWDPAKKSLRGTRYYTHGDEQVAVRTAADDGTTPVSYLINDHHGTNVTQIGSVGLDVTRRTLDEFGNERLKQSAPWTGNKGFVGGTIDRTTGLTQLGARPYDPQLGRFISVDPVLDPTSPQQLNAYQYANSAPATISDPDGTWWGEGAWKKAKKKVATVTHKATNWVKQKVVHPVVKQVKKVYHKYVPKKLQKIVRSVKQKAAKAWKSTKRWVKTKAWPTIKRAYHATRKYVAKQVKAAGNRIRKAGDSVSSGAKKASDAISHKVDSFKSDWKHKVVDVAVGSLAAMGTAACIASVVCGGGLFIVGAAALFTAGLGAHMAVASDDERRKGGAQFLLRTGKAEAKGIIGGTLFGRGLVGGVLRGAKSPAVSSLSSRGGSSPLLYGVPRSQWGSTIVNHVRNLF